MNIEELLKKIADLISQYETENETIIRAEIGVDGINYHFNGESLIKNEHHS